MLNAEPMNRERLHKIKATVNFEAVNAYKKIKVRCGQKQKGFSKHLGCCACFGRNRRIFQDTPGNAQNRKD